MQSRKPNTRTRGSFRGKTRGGRAQFGRQEPAQPKGELLFELRERDLENELGIAYEKARIEDCSFVTSFNWLAGTNGNATILIPGEPPRWSPLAESVQLRQDSGTYFRDENAARFPKYPMEPTVVALLDTAPDLTNAVDLVACGSTFGNLLRFVRGDSKNFRILVQQIGQTVFLIRREKSPTATVEDVYGYGHSFLEAYTSWPADVKRSESHQRLMNYRFAGLNMLMRFEGDCYLPEDPTPTPRGIQSTSTGTVKHNIDDISSQLSVATVVSSTATPHGRLSVIRAGSIVQPQRICDVKTRSIKKKDVDTLGDQLPRLWARQISNFILGHHMSGTFHDIEVKNVEEDVATWELEHQKELSRLGRLLRRIVEVVGSRADKKLELCCDDGYCLQFCEQPEGIENALSDEVTKRWNAAIHDKPKASVASVGIDWESDEEKDYTACTPSCGYCGSCTY